MKEKIKDLLKAIHVYHPLQSFYRSVIHQANKSFNRYAYTKFKGAGLTCNVCQSSYTKFIDKVPSAENRQAINDYKVIAGYGQNIICPHCMSTARERLVLAMLQEMNLKDKSILHFSPEKNIFRYLKKIASVISADLAPGFYRKTDNRIVKEDATQLSFPDDTFDLVIANHIMEHIPNDLAAMREIYRVLKPGGRAILQVPYATTISTTMEQPGIADPKRQSALFGQKDHVRIYALFDYINRLKSVGFEVIEVTYEAMARLHINAIQKGESFLQITKAIS